MTNIFIPENLINIIPGADGFLGNGTFGEVRKGTQRLLISNRIEEIPVAIKCLNNIYSDRSGRKKKGQQMSENSIQLVMNQILEDCKISCKLNHPYISICNGLVLNNQNKPIYIVQPNFSCSLRDVMYGPQFSAFREIHFMDHNREVVRADIITNLLCDIFAGLVFLHSQSPPVIHHDIKPSNILMEIIGGSIMRAMLSDIGEAKFLFSAMTNPPTILSSYVAPECKQQDFSDLTKIKTGGAAADIFSMGVVTTELCSGLRPKSQSVQPTGLGSVTEGVLPLREIDHRMNELAAIPPKLHLLRSHICEPCLAEDPTCRPLALTIQAICHVTRDAFGEIEAIRSELLEGWNAERMQLESLLSIESESHRLCQSELELIQKDVKDLRKQVQAAGGSIGAAGGSNGGKKRDRGEDTPKPSGPYVRSKQRADLIEFEDIDNVTGAIGALQLSTDNSTDVELCAAGLACIGRTAEARIEHVTILGNAGVCPHIYHLLECHLEVDKIVICACWAMISLATVVENIDRLGAAGCCQSVVKAMSRHAANPLVCEWACKAIYNLSFKNEQNRIRLREAGGCEEIVKALLRHVGVATVCLYGAWAVHNMTTKDAANKSSFLALGAIAALREAIRRHETNTEVKRQAELAMSKLL